MGRESRASERWRREAEEAALRERHPVLFPAVKFVTGFIAYFTTGTAMLRIERAVLWTLVTLALLGAFGR
jgi:hypothetical protein